MPKISIIIPTFNSADTILNCVHSILKSNISNFELIIVDDKSTDNTIKILNAIKGNKKITILFHKKNRGAAVTRNDGARIARGEYLVYFDSDFVVDKNCIANLVRPMEKNKKIGMTQGAIIDPQTKSVESVGHFLTIFGFPYDLNEDIYTKSKKPIRILGTRAVFSYRKKLFDIMGGYDEDYIFHGEDTDISWRICLTGYQIYFIPDAKAYHYHVKAETKKIGHYAFYEGAKNQISNIIKNAPLKYVWFMLPLNICIWLLLSMKLILQGRFSLALWIYKGILWDIFNIGKTIKKRLQVAGYTPKNDDTDTIMFGPMTITSFLKKGSRWFLNV